MKKIAATLLLASIFVSSAYADERNPEIPHHHQGTTPKPDDYHSPAAPPPEGKEVRKYAIDEPGPTAKNFGLPVFNDNELFMKATGDRLEYRTNNDNDIALWDITAWAGGDYNKLYLESEGEYNLREKDIETATVELFWNRAIRPYWDTQLGIRRDFIADEDDRNFLAAGVQGKAPYMFETDITGYVSDEGDISATLEIERSWYLTQRLAFQPRFETEFAVQDVKDYNIGSGMTGFETGLRLRYEVTRKFAPYIGVSYEQAVGETANLIEQDGGETSDIFFVTGVKFWF